MAKHEILYEKTSYLDQNTVDLDWRISFSLCSVCEGCKCTPSTVVWIGMKPSLSQILTFHLNKKWHWFAININLFSGALDWARCWSRSVVHGITGLYWSTSWENLFREMSPQLHLLHSKLERSGIQLLFPDLLRCYSFSLSYFNWESSIMEMWSVLQQCQNLPVRGVSRALRPLKGLDPDGLSSKPRGFEELEPSIFYWTWFRINLTGLLSHLWCC